MPEYTAGTRVRIGNHSGDVAREPFKTQAGVVTEPDTVTIIVVQADGTRKVYGYPVEDVNGLVIKEAGQTARYYVEETVYAPGTWFYREEGTGAVQAASEGNFNVRASSV
jgi:hypothetical protein